MTAKKLASTAIVGTLIIAGAWLLRAPRGAPAVSWPVPDAAPKHFQESLKAADSDSSRTREAVRKRIADIESERRERIARDTEARLTRVRESGGPLASMKLELESLSHRRDLGAALADRESRLRAVVGLPCTEPTIYGELSRYINVHAEVFPSDRPTDVDRDFVVEPTATIVIAGCHFGSVPGEIRLRGGPRPGGYLALAVEANGWSDDIIKAELPPYPGHPDSDAELVVVSSTGAMSYPMPVLFRQRRVADSLDAFSHRTTLGVACATQTSEDLCVGLAPPDATGVRRQAYPLAGYHRQDCCGREWGTDVWTITLKNGWRLWEHGDIGALGDEWHARTWALPFSLSTRYHGFTDCTFYNDPGQIKNKTFTVLSDEPYTAQIAIAWWVDWTCSGISYAADGVAIVGPEGMPYW